MRHLIWTSALISLTLAACGSDPTPPPEAPPSSSYTDDDGEEPSGKKDDNAEQSSVNISDKIRTACGLSDAEAHFAYNSANVRASDRQVLKKLADCFVSGPLKGREMNLVGHADPRGETEYNFVLGGRRADNVAAALKNEGLPANQVSTTSRGELDATGTDEASWAKDRRVDVHLVE